MSIEVLPKENAFNRMVAETFEDEGGFSNLDADPGGATRYGITEAVAREHGFEGDMRELTKSFALHVYKQSYFNGPGYDGVASHSYALAKELFDCAVNIGPQRASSMLQRALNLLNRRGKDYRDIKMDGDVGEKTLQALNAYLQLRGEDGEKILLKALLCQRGSYYMDLSAADQKFELFLNGWLSKRVDMERITHA